jgi:thioredoxin 1
MSVIALNKENFDKEVLESDKPVLVDFWAEWCGPCKMLSPVVEQIADEREDIKVCKVNIDDEMELALKYNVMSIPTVISFDRGELKKRTVGVCPKDEILAII